MKSRENPIRIDKIIPTSSLIKLNMGCLYTSTISSHAVE
jgi:hypothetical protein